jgi:hypothetical protein
MRQKDLKMKNYKKNMKILSSLRYKCKRININLIPDISNFNRFIYHYLLCRKLLLYLKVNKVSKEKIYHNFNARV